MCSKYRMYYLWSLLISIIIFVLIQYSEYQKDQVNYKLYSLSNFAILCIIYLLITMVLFLFIESSAVSTKKSTKFGGNIKSTQSLDPIILRKISDPVYTGFEPYDHSPPEI
jgi:hypothetical protein